MWPKPMILEVQLPVIAIINSKLGVTVLQCEQVSFQSYDLFSFATRINWDR
jgi:hypothetical protein